jgi:hypothetical protein
MTTPAIYLKALKQIGSEWQKGSMHRIYFNDLASWYGLKLEYYGTGNVSAAYLDGNKISNNYGTQLDTAFRLGKVWYDVSSSKFLSRDLDERYTKKIVAAIKTHVEGLVDELDEQEICSKTGG